MENTHVIFFEYQRIAYRRADTGVKSFASIWNEEFYLKGIFKLKSSILEFIRLGLKEYEDDDGSAKLRRIFLIQITVRKIMGNSIFSVSHWRI